MTASELLIAMRAADIEGRSAADLDRLLDAAEQTYLDEAKLMAVTHADLARVYSL